MKLAKLRRLRLKAKVATQMGTQIHASNNYHRVVELIQSRGDRPVREAHVWVGRAWGLQSQAEAEQYKDRVFVTERPTEEMPVPDYLEWDLWLGPARPVPYTRFIFPVQLVSLVGLRQWHHVATWEATGTTCRIGHLSSTRP